MAEVKGLKAGATGIEQMGATDTIPVANVPTITAAKVSDFTEAAQDSVGAMADANTLTYTDATPLLEVKKQMSITADTSGLKLDGDEATPGNSQYYGTDSGGTKGYFALPTVSLGETYTAGEALTAGNLCYITSSGTIMKADANDANKLAQGFVVDSISNGATGIFYRGHGKVTGLTGLTAGSRYFLSNSTTGAIALYASLTYSTSDIQQYVGRAESTTVLAFEPGDTILIS